MLCYRKCQPVDQKGSQLLAILYLSTFATLQASVAEVMDLFRRGQSEEDEGTAAEEAETTAKQEADTMRPQRPSKKRRRQE